MSANSLEALGDKMRFQLNEILQEKKSKSCGGFMHVYVFVVHLTTHFSIHTDLCCAFLFSKHKVWGLSECKVSGCNLPLIPSLLSNRLTISPETQRKLHFCLRQNVFLLGFFLTRPENVHRNAISTHTQPDWPCQASKPSPDRLAYWMQSTLEKWNDSEKLQPIRETASWNHKRRCARVFLRTRLNSAAH